MSFYHLVSTKTAVLTLTKCRHLSIPINLSPNENVTNKNSLFFSFYFHSCSCRKCRKLTVSRTSQTTDRAKTRHHATTHTPHIFGLLASTREPSKQRRGVTVLWLTSNVPQPRVIAQKHAAHFVIDSAEEVCQYSHIMCR